MGMTQAIAHVQARMARLDEGLDKLKAEFAADPVHFLKWKTSTVILDKTLLDELGRIEKILLESMDVAQAEDRMADLAARTTERILSDPPAMSSSGFISNYIELVGHAALCKLVKKELENVIRILAE